MKLLDFPMFQQTFEFDCGAQALHSVLTFYGIDTSEMEIIKIAGTSGKYGTPIHGMEKVARHFDLKCDIKKMTINDIKKNIPVILLIQAWSNRKIKDWENDWKDGHYVVAVGYDSKKIYFEDPYSYLRTYLFYKELEGRWHDLDVSANKEYKNTGIIIKGKKKKYSSKKKLHME